LSRPCTGWAVKKGNRGTVLFFGDLLIIWTVFTESNYRFFQALRRF
jgi:hypothetical protein